jgi:hypothetical protein
LIADPALSNDDAIILCKNGVYKKGRKAPNERRHGAESEALLRSKHLERKSKIGFVLQKPAKELIPSCIFILHNFQRETCVRFCSITGMQGANGNGPGGREHTRTSECAGNVVPVGFVLIDDLQTACNLRLVKYFPLALDKRSNGGL